MRLNNPRKVESRGGLFSLFLLGGGAAGVKVKHCSIPLWCAVSCVSLILTRLILEGVKGVYTISST